MAEINWVTTPEDSEIIRLIVKRAIEVAERIGISYTKLDCEMDITCVHANTCPLRLKELLEAPPADFGHDVFGIRRHLNRETGQLIGCFLPRFAAKQSETKTTAAVH